MQTFFTTFILDISPPLSSAIPAGNVAHGLAWSYFFGFLNIILPGKSKIGGLKYLSYVCPTLCLSVHLPVFCNLLRLHI